MDKNLTFPEFMNHVKSRNHERKGQALMNALSLYRKSLFNKIANTSLDCFYQDQRYPKSLEWIEENW